MLKPPYNKKITDDWKKYIVNIDDALNQLSKKTIISIGIVPYSRVVLGLFLRNFIIFCARYSRETKLMRSYMKVICVEERFPKIVNKLQSVGYMIQNFSFQQFIKRQSPPYTLMFYNITDFIAKGLNKQNLPFIGNEPDVKKEVLVKLTFRKLLEELNLPHLPNWQISREEFLNQTFETVRERLNGSFVVQRGDIDVGGEEATFFVHTPEQFNYVLKIFAADSRFSHVEINPFISGNAYSMVGCAIKGGVICGPLQLQLIDIPESLGTYPGKGVFVGHDWGLTDWSQETQEQITALMKKLGQHLYDQGFRGVFGVDFILDPTTGTMFPLECNPRFTGSFPMISLLAIMQGLPPLDLIHVLEHENIKTHYTQELFADYQFSTNFSHIQIMAHGIDSVPVDLEAGIYRFEEETAEIIFVRPALLPAEIQNQDEFLVIDSVFPVGSNISHGATRLFKLIFPCSIAKSSYELQPRFATIVKIFSDLLYDNA